MADVDTPLMDQLYLEHAQHTTIRTPRELKCMHVLCRALETINALPVTPDNLQHKQYLKRLLAEARDTLT